MIDFVRGAKTTGSKFYFASGDDALLEMYLINKMIKFHVNNGYKFVIPPYLVRRSVGEMAGQLPRFEGDYYMTTDNLMLIPTAETAMVGLHSDEIFDESDLPIKYVAFSPCFRREAGSHGQRDKGLKRVHQFHKVELFVICTPSQSDSLHQKMIEEVKQLLDILKVEHRSVELDDIDKSPTANKTIDIELAYNDEWLEVSSISNTGDNQSKPAKIRYRPKLGGKAQKVHLLNGSGVALPRLLLALKKEKK